MSEHRRHTLARRQLAQAAARLLAEDPALDPERALRKAAGRLGVRDNRQWPGPAEVQEALAEERRLFHPGQPEALLDLRRRALAAMRHFAPFRPRLVGPVLDGSADAASRVRLYLFADDPDQVLHALLEQRIPWEQRDYRLRYADGQRRAHPAFRFVAGGVGMELVVLPPQALANPPLDPLTERPERGADAARVEELLAEATEGP